MPKFSRYNHFQEWNDGFLIAFNAMTGAIALLTPDNIPVFDRLKDKMSKGGNPDFTEDERKLIEDMKIGRFVIDDDQDENYALRFSHNHQRYSTAALSLTIAPTMACNMACGYCYEGNKAGRMSDEIIEAVLKFAEKQARQLQTISVCWYGGEPLLAMDIIEKISDGFLRLSREHEVNYIATIISNGYLLTRETVDRLVDNEVKSIQVTLDGPARIHNVKRPLKNGITSFDTIIENITYASTKMKVGVRVNIAKGFTKEVIGELLLELEKAGLAREIKIAFGRLEPHTAVCAAIAESCFNASEFGKAEIEFLRLMLDRDFRIDRLPRPISTACMSHNINNFVVDPEGHLYNCFHHVGMVEKAIGVITDNIDYNNRNFKRLFNFDPFTNEECSQCSVLPTCMGGCPVMRIERGITGEALCGNWKHNLGPMLEIIARSKYQEYMKKIEEEVPV